MAIGTAGVTRLYATRVGRALRPADVMLEQPCKTLEDCAAVKKATGLPMKIDENAHDTDSLLRAYALGCMMRSPSSYPSLAGLAPPLVRVICAFILAHRCVLKMLGVPMWQ